MPPPASATTMSPPYLQEATKNSTVAWQQHLASLFRHCKERFPDVVWELTGEEDETNIEEVFGHKAIVYARAPPSFQSRYFSFRPNNATSPLPYSTSPTPSYPATSALSLGLEYPTSDSRASSPFRSTSPSPSTNPAGPLLRIRTSHNPALFSNELEYLYTGQGFGEAFEFLFDSAESREEGDAEELRIDKLRKDLVYMWRSRLYSDVRLALTGNFSSTNHETTTAVFATHRFILVSRCPYFHTALLAWPSKPVSQTAGEPLTLNLPSPPFTPASVHFTLGFIYTGTLVFSHRTYDLDTAFQIMRSATYLGLQTLYDEIQARLVQEMMHGLFHAFLEFSEYENLTGGKWGTGGCRCRQCARRAPRILEFAMMEDVKNAHLDRGARRALVGLFGEGWCTTDFAALPQKTRESLLKGVGKRTTPANAFALLFAAEHATNKMSAVIDTWADTVREMILAARKVIDEVICSQSKDVFEQPDWLDLMRSDGDGFEDKDRVKLIMDAAIRGLSDKNAPTLYQTLVGTILLRPHPTEPEQAMLSSTSSIRELVEQARVDVLRWIGKRWLGIRHEGGFAGLDGWALHEISDSIDVSIEDLETPQPRGSGHHSRNAHKSLLITKPDGESDTMSMHSMRVSLLSRNLPKRGATPTQREVVASSGASIRSVRSTVSTASRATNNTLNIGVGVGPVHERHRKKGGSGGGPDLGPRPDSKLTPEPEALRARSPSPTQPSIIEPPPDERLEDDHFRQQQRSTEDEPEGFEGNTTPSTPLPKTLVKRIGATATSPIPGSSPSGKRTPSGSSSRGTNTPIGSSGGISLRPKASASSISPSLRSHASTVRKSSAGNTNSTYASLRPPSTHGSSARDPHSHSNRPISSVSTNTESGASFRTASSRARRSSAASMQSGLSVRTGQGHGGSPSGKGVGVGVSPSTSPVRSRKLSNSSTTSTTTNNTTTTTNRSVSTTTTTHSTTGGNSNKRTPVTPTSAGGRGRETNRLSPGTPTGAGGAGAAGKRPVSVASNKSGSTNTSGGTAGSKKVLVTIRRPASNVSLRSEALAAAAASGDSLAPPALPSLPQQIEKSVSGGSSVSSRTSGSAGSRESRTSKALSVAQSTTTTTTTTSATMTTAVSEVSSASGRSESRTSMVSRTGTNMTTAREDGMSVGGETEDHQDEDEDGDDRMGQPPPHSLPKQEEEADYLANTASNLTVRPFKINRDSAALSSSDYASASSGPSPRNSTKDLDHKKTDSNTSVGSVATLKRKGSNDTITTLNPKGSSSRGGSKPSSQVSSVAPSRRPEDPMLQSQLQTPQMAIVAEQEQYVFQPRGATLDIGIPCIISSKRKRFKAFARYIGEVEGETGPWVGVEVPFPESWTGDRDKLFEGEGRQWHDGSWGGVRYFEIGGGMGGGGGEWDMDDDRASRRRRMERDHWSGGKGYLKREGDQLSIQRERAKRMRSVSPAVSDMSMSESRGLFVRPQQVLYVVDAVGSDL
ncbi:hypothetical protein BDN72DRAFT_827296 [Pluteus cervinus]|uniref:Uncharacterized protein n=1 Tax=Pluteus cervinus TaxID=181527 RepID=A0ACD3AAI6_9AGAR|nr:hypothetical protein BDN72DRAFT_827296 [Pluteus cervinus]